jgi:transposase-like protein
MDKKSRRQHSPEDKVRILRLHLLEHKPISQLCEEEGIHPTLFYQWQKAFFENGAAAFQRSPRTETTRKRDGLVEQLQAKLQRKDEVIAEIAEDLIREKKANGAS